MILLAILCPPLAVLLCGKPFQALLNILLCFAAVVPGIVHAILVVNASQADKRQDKLIKSMATIQAVASAKMGQTVTR